MYHVPWVPAQYAAVAWQDSGVVDVGGRGPKGRRSDFLAQIAVVPAVARAHRRRWTALLPRILDIDGTLCPNCGGSMRLISLTAIHAKERAFVGPIRSCRSD